MSGRLVIDMSSEMAETLLEILGNESRRRILALLSKKPCYVSEISYSLKMAPKAVIEHLEKLEKAGIIRSFEEGRRRYYCINKSVRIEITIAPHMFETSVITGINGANVNKIANEVKKIMDINLDKTNFIQLSNVIEEIEKVQRDISKIQGMINRRINEAFDKLTRELNEEFRSEVERVVILGISKGLKSAEEIAEQFGLSYKDVRKTLENLERRGIVTKALLNDKEIWSLKI